MSSNTDMPPQVIDALLKRERFALAGRMLAGVVHNLSSPIQMVTLSLDRMEMLMERGEDPHIEKSWKHLKLGTNKLTDQIKLLGSKVQQMQDVEPREIDLAQMAQEQLAYWEADMFFKHRVEYKFDLPLGCTRVRAAYADVALSFNALIANALEALEASSQAVLKVMVHSQPGQAGLLVLDGGPGPEEAMTGRMFEPFVGDKGGEHEGLGLFLARKALDRWDGELSWRSGELDGFFVSLPALS